MTNGACVAIVGAGVAGLAAALALRRRGIAATVFEASPRIGGRAVTRERAGVRFDTGAQFFRTESAAARRLVLEDLPRDDLVDIRKDVLPFDVRGRIGPGDATQNNEPKWVYREGIGWLAALLMRTGRPVVHLGAEISALAWDADGWRLETRLGAAGVFEAVLITAPPAATSAVLERSAFDESVGERLLDVLAAVRYRCLVTVTLGCRERPPQPAGAYALVNSDRKHAVSWLAFEHEKPRYVPEGPWVLVAQMADAWSRPRLAAVDRDLAGEARQEIAGLLGTRVTELWSEVTRWHEALPADLAPAPSLETAEHLGLFFAGDAARGGRVHLAIESGTEAAGRIARYTAGVSSPP